MSSWTRSKPHSLINILHTGQLQSSVSCYPTASFQHRKSSPWQWKASLSTVCVAPGRRPLFHVCYMNFSDGLHRNTNRLGSEDCCLACSNPQSRFHGFLIGFIILQRPKLHLNTMPYRMWPLASFSHSRSSHSHIPIHSVLYPFFLSPSFPSLFLPLSSFLHFSLSPFPAPSSPLMSLPSSPHSPSICLLHPLSPH